MRYYSTNHNAPLADFKEATIRGLAPDKGLYFPQEIPGLPENFIKNVKQYSREDIALQIISPYVGAVIPASEMESIIHETINFNFPLVRLTDNISSLELFHGPTLAFKDVGARFMSRCLRYFVKDQNKKVTVLVATSGDTGGAVANGFYDIDGVDVVILYPSGKVSDIQEMQLTTLGKNITVLEIEGTFDDCQQMVKQAFVDIDLQKNLFLTSANSINIARWLPQQFYYFFGYQQWEEEGPPVISVPSGNFGNLSAGLLAYKSGLPVSHFIAACNANDTVPVFLQTGNYQPKKSVATISNAMDVGDPSNFVRMHEIFKGEASLLRTMLSGYSISDLQTRETIKKVYGDTDYLLDPHGAVGYTALEKYITDHKQSKGFFLETAHPVKFLDVIEPVIERSVEIPRVVSELVGRKKQSLKMNKEFIFLKQFLLTRGS